MTLSGTNTGEDPRIHHGLNLSGSSSMIQMIATRAITCYMTRREGSPVKITAVLLLVLLFLSSQPVFAEEGPTPYDDSSLVCISDKTQPGSNGVSVLFSEVLLAKMHDLHIRISEMSETNRKRGWVELFPRVKDSVEIHAKFYSQATGMDLQSSDTVLVNTYSQKVRKSETAKVRFSCPQPFNYVIFY